MWNCLAQVYLLLALQVLTMGEAYSLEQRLQLPDCGPAGTAALQAGLLCCLLASVY